MKKSIKLITNLTLSFLIGFISIGSSLNNVYASEDSNTYKITIDSELAYKFSELNEVASKSYDLKNTDCVAACVAEPVDVPICAACIAGVATMGTGNIAGVIACFRLL